MPVFTGSSVGVIVPTHNRSRLLGRALSSVLAQTAGVGELVVVDDGSEDETQVVIRELGDPRISYLRLPVNRGQAAARNAGHSAWHTKSAVVLHWVRAEGLERMSMVNLDLGLGLLDCHDDLAQVALILEGATGVRRQDREHGLRPIEGSRRVVRNKLWAFRLYRGGAVPALAWWAVSLPVKMVVFRS